MEMPSPTVFHINRSGPSRKLYFSFNIAERILNLLYLNATS